MKNNGVAHAGDIIYVDRGVYKHYGVYIGNGRIVHFAASADNELDADNAYIQETSIEEFLRGGTGYIDSDCEPVYSPEDTVRRACSHIGKGKGYYDLVFCNCEHFARWCKTGKSESAQVNGVVKEAGFLTGLFCGGLPVMMQSLQRSPENN